MIEPWAGDWQEVEGSENRQREEWIWLYSGNLGRAHEWEALVEVQALLEKEGVPARLVFQGGGALRDRVEERAREMKLLRCEFRGYVTAEQLAGSLLEARVLVVTRRVETQGLLWPSKLALMLELPRSILWVGDVDGAAAARLGRSSSCGVFKPGAVKEIAQWLKERGAEEKSFMFEGEGSGETGGLEGLAVVVGGKRKWKFGQVSLS
ncbi:MAG: glycosyltransferase family 4 protein [Blastochloris sp.]|nr:glycosyltransferase family 4 protein [Blastochloris sp.]